MTMTIRVAVVAMSLGLLLAAKTALFGYLQAAGPLRPVALVRPLATFPWELGPWRGRDLATNPRFLYGDDHLSRVYGRRDRQQTFQLWMAYSAVGEDRGHHPEVCMMAAGLAEDPAGRALVPAEGHAEPIQQFRFGRVEEGKAVCGLYWHYTLAPPADDRASAIQRAYQRFQRRPSSLTIEVFSRAVAEKDVALRGSSRCAVDRAVQSSLPPGAVRGSARLPVLLLNEGGVKPG